MRFLFYSVRSFEPWCWKNSVEQGIGGSETSHVEMAHRIARHGHEVISYVPLPDDVPSGSEWRGTRWYHHRDVDWSQPGIWVLYRCPEALDHFDPARTDQVKWLIFQDWWYPDLTPERVAKLHRAVILCKAHEDFLLHRCPELKGLTWITRNAIKNDLIAEVEAAGLPARNPRRIMYASSPDRGLLSALKVYQRAKETVPDLEFVATYGYDNLNKLIAQGGYAKEARDRDECLRLMDITGATFLGRISQNQLYREWFKTAMTVYITSFFETGWITGLEAQAMGAIPIFSPVYAQGENTRHGYQVIGDPKKEPTIAEAAMAVVRFATDPALQEKIRGPMMADVRAKWDWEQFVSLKPGENWLDAATEDMERLAPRPAIALPPVAFTSASLLPDPGNPEVEQASRDRWLRLAAGSVMLDIGACHGSWSAPALESGATVYAIDSGADMAALVEYAARTGAADRLTVSHDHMGDGTALTPTVPVDAFVQSHRLDRLDFVKIDAEGDELCILRGATGTIARFHPRVMVEVHTYKGVSVEAVKALIDPTGDRYRFEDVNFQDYYHHLYAEPVAQPLALCDNDDEAASRTRWLHLEADDIVFDVGAADGSWSIPAARQGALVYAFEPDPRTWLARAIEQFGLQNLIHPVAAYVSDRCRQDGAAPTFTLDTFAMSVVLPYCSFIKIDVEGEELRVLNGAIGLIRRFRPRLMVEVHTETVPGRRVELAEVTRFLDMLELGYRYESVELQYQGRRYYHLFAETDDTVVDGVDEISTEVATIA